MKKKRRTFNEWLADGIGWWVERVDNSTFKLQNYYIKIHSRRAEKHEKKMLKGTKKL